MIVLDTSSIIDLLEGHSRGQKVREKLENEAAAVSAITMHEILVGVEDSQKRITQDFIKTVHVLAFDADAAYKSVLIEKSLARKGKLIGKLDMLIAATCIVHDLPLLTSNTGFKHVEGLQLITLS